MPLARYFLYVGGVLLALLLILDAYLPQVPVSERAHVDLPLIRIHSAQKWPERVVYDTSLPTVVPPQIASGEASIPAPVKARERDALALSQPSDASEPKPSTSKKSNAKPQRERKIARRHARPRQILVARRWQFGWFDNRFW